MPSRDFAPAKVSSIDQRRAYHVRTMEASALEAVEKKAWMGRPPTKGWTATTLRAMVGT
jgi:hypothetical protein